MSALARMLAAVSVATVWTSPESPRRLDEPALQNPADISGWIGALTVPDKLNLSDDNRVQTQVLFGTELFVGEERGDWVLVYIPGQMTSKHVDGYPGWMPKCQLAEPPSRPVGAAWAEVRAMRATLTLGSKELELSYLTRLPLLEVTADAIRVITPVGEGLLSRKEAEIARDPAKCGSLPAHTGRSIAEEAVKFTGLPYLWGGLSSFGFDCSGFAYMMHRSQGIAIPRDASDQARYGDTIARDHLAPGDLVFFAADEGKGHIHHVGIYIGDGRMIHSPDSRGAVETVPLDEGKLGKEHCLSKRYWGEGAAYAG
ncbi:NlpC/P60 family protein [Paenibacillus mesophilus]|uniref:C40 family peptidase n=1 Tax=Paenibacillus mesophilus TaxID=2582849 RepID=UPI00110E9A83|nr:C40 family peptidase [Paenibacillus mesophilus]TMV47015.1 NlpC/P60 family protein [Paenibacillus mesophilus]